MLCFGQTSPPEDRLVGMLLGIVFTERERKEVVEEEEAEGGGGRLGTRKLTPFEEKELDKTPVIRSFLLQLLLEHE